MSVIKGHGTGDVSGDFYSYKINQSLRFDDDSNTYLNKTPSGSGNQKTWTYSFWFKHGSRTAIFDLLLANASGDKFFEFSITNAQLLQVFYHNETMLVSDMQLRDRSAWYHVVLRHDTTQASADNRLRIYVNGTEVTSWATNGRANLPQDFDGGVNEGSISHLIGRNHVGNNDFDGYLAEVNFIDGTSLAPSSFGETKDGIWIPKQYSTSDGAYGTNGFYLPFDDSSAIGDDESPNTNDWTANSFSTYDVVKDSPTNNWCVVNPLQTSAAALAEGNLKVTTASGTYGYHGTTFAIPASGKWYAEVLILTLNSTNATVGVSPASEITETWFYNADGVTYYGSNGYKYIAAQTASSYGASFGAGDLIGIAVNVDDSEVTFYKNNSSQGAITSENAAGFFFDAGNDSTGAGVTVIWNFGQDSSFVGEGTRQNNADDNGVGDFYYSPPSGFLALCSENLDTPAIIDGSDNFNTVLYTGTGSSNSVTGVGFQPDWVWGKRRDSTGNHWLNDAVRGATKGLHSDSTSAEYTDATVMIAFNSDGFSVVSHAISNASSATYVAWNWLASTAFSNDASATSVGTIDSEGRVNTKAGTAIIKWTGTGSNGTIAHGLDAAPQFIIAKNRSQADEWPVLETVVNGGTHYLRLNGTDASTTTSIIWNDTNPTSSVFSVGTYDYINGSGENYISYIFHSVEGYSKVGSYLGNGSADGPFIYTGFRPAWVLFRGTSVASNWVIIDSTRSPFNLADEVLLPNGTNSTITNMSDVDLVSNGIKIRDVVTNDTNVSGHTYVYLAFAESPFKFANAR